MRYVDLGIQSFIVIIFFVIPFAAPFALIAIALAQLLSCVICIIITSRFRLLRLTHLILSILLLTDLIPFPDGQFFFRLAGVTPYLVCTFYYGLTGASVFLTRPPFIN